MGSRMSPEDRADVEVRSQRLSLEQVKLLEEVERRCDKVGITVVPYFSGSKLYARIVKIEDQRGRK